MKIAVNILLAATLVAVLAQVATGAMGRSRATEDRGRMQTEAKRIRAEMQAHFETHGAYPLEPLGTRRDEFGKLLLNGKPDGYDAPDDQGPNAEYWLEMTSEADPAFRIVIANSDDAPSAAGRWLDGVYVCEAGGLVKL